MFKFKYKKKFVVLKAVKGDIIRCNLHEGEKSEFLVEEVTPFGVKYGIYIDGDNKYDGARLVWPYGDNYDVLCSVTKLY